MINYIKDAVSAVSGIKTFLFNTDYRNNFDFQNVEFPCCVLTPIMRTNYDLNNIIRESAELQLSVVESAPYDYSGDDLYAINKKCSDLALQVIANLQVKSKLDKELTFEFILPSGDELISGVMCNLQCTMKQGSCIGAPSYIEVVVQPLKKESITRNGKYIISPSSRFTAMREVEVKVEVDLKGSLQDKQVTITENGTQTITADEGYEGLNSVVVNASVAPPFGLIGWDAENMSVYDAQLAEDIAYSKTLYDAWDASITNAPNYYKNNKAIVYAPYIDTRNLTNAFGLFYGCINLAVVPKLNTSKVTNAQDMFINCKTLRTIPLLDFSNVRDLKTAFANCTSLESIPPLDFSNVIDAWRAFANCTSLESIPPLDFSNCTRLHDMLNGCTALKSATLLNTGKVSNFQSLFYCCTNIESISLLDTSSATNITVFLISASKLTTLGGFKNLKASLDLSPCKLLTHESLMNVINNLYDLASNGLGAQTLTLGATNLAKLTDEEKAIAVDKGWTLS